jgi:hypothetical protein
MASADQASISELPLINWEYIMADVMQEAGATRRS